MQRFTAFEYMLIDAANHFGLDKLKWDERIDWAKRNLYNLEAFQSQADDPAQFCKAVLAIRKVQAGLPTGHLISLDAICSGIQVMSALTRCVKGCQATGLIDTGERPDCYTKTTQRMNELLKQAGIAEVTVSRADAKDAMMTAGYGSHATPKRIFGDLTPYFWQACKDVAPNAFILMDALLKTWKTEALYHSWELPDGFQVYCPVENEGTLRVRVDEMKEASVYFKYTENAVKEFSKENAANFIHSIDAFILRNMIRRCSYNKEMLEAVDRLLTIRLLSDKQECEPKQNEQLQRLVRLGEEAKWIDPVVFNHITEEADAWLLTVEQTQAYLELCQRLLSQPRFDILTVHDAYKCHPKYGNQVRKHYIEIMAEISDSNILEVCFSKLSKQHVPMKFGASISHLIREANYPLS